MNLPVLGARRPSQRWQAATGGCYPPAIQVVSDEPQAVSDQEQAVGDQEQAVVTDQE